MNIPHLLFELFTNSIFIYSIALICFYAFFCICAFSEIKRYLKRNKFTDFNVLASSEYAPSFSIVAPAYNEGVTVIENVRSLLSLHYNNYEVIIVNDGSKDDSLGMLIKEYDLVKVPYEVNEQIRTKPVKAVYKSKNPVFKKLVVVDKVNGAGKSDAANAGINVAVNQYIVCTDVDCILEQDALLKLAKSFLDNQNTRVIATGGVVRIANSCEVKSGKIVRVNLPKQFLPRIQTLEYIRAFLLGRMAWSRLNGLLLVSGAFGAFDREIMIKAGGYNAKTVGEDLDLIIRMRRYMEEQNQIYKVIYIPDPLCWTQVPFNYQSLAMQRNRWARGAVENIIAHRVMFFNKRYGLLGFLSYPYLFFFEFLAPFIEFSGYIAFIALVLSGLVNWHFYLALLIFIYCFGVLFSLFAILMEVISYNQYQKKGEIFKLVVAALVETIIFHPFVVWSAIRGHFDFIRKKHGWGEMSRQGFNSPSSVAAN